MKFKKRPLMALTLSVVGAALLYQLHRQEMAMAPTAKTAQSHQPLYSIADARWTRYNVAGQPTLTGTVKQANYFNDGGGTASDVKITTLSPNHPSWTMSAPLANMPAERKSIFLSGKVVLNGDWPDGTPLQATTQSLWVNPQTDQLHGEDPVKLTGSGRSGQAVGIRGNWAEQNLELLSDVKMQYDAPSR